MRIDVPGDADGTLKITAFFDAPEAELNIVANSTGGLAVMCFLCNGACRRLETHFSGCFARPPDEPTPVRPSAGPPPLPGGAVVPPPVLPPEPEPEDAVGPMPPVPDEGLAAVDNMAWRLAVARRAGLWVARTMREGRPRGASGRSAIALQNRVWMVFRTAAGTDCRPPRCFDRWAGARELVDVWAGHGRPEEGRAMARDAVHIAWPSWAEAEACSLAAGAGWPGG